MHDIDGRYTLRISNPIRFETHYFNAYGNLSVVTFYIQLLVYTGEYGNICIGFPKYFGWLKEYVTSKKYNSE